MNQHLTVRDKTTEISPWQAFADKTVAAAIAGDLLKFVKGKWYRGEDKTPVPPEARFLCQMEEIWTGWVRWFDGKPVEHRIGRLVDFLPEVTREELGHTDESVWETDPQGNPRDPWAPTDRMVMRDVGESTELLTFSTSSVGGRYALGKLCSSFSRARQKHEGQWPVIELEVETYTHNVYGEISKPRFKIVDWDFWDDSNKPITQTDDDPRTLAKTAEALNDEIPF